MSVSVPWRARLRGLLRHIGFSGAFGILVLLSSAAFYAAVLRPAERELVALRFATFDARSHRADPIALDRESEDLRRFHALFPAPEDLPDQVEHLFALARAADLVLAQGQYRMEPRPGGPMAYRVVLPVRGSYTQIRTFVSSVLSDMPIASVDALRFERKKRADTQLDAQVRLTIHVRSAEELR